MNLFKMQSLTSKHIPCPCGSGKKLLKCCYNKKTSAGITYKELIKINRAFQRIRREREEYRKYWNTNYGEVEMTVNACVGDKRYVQVRGKTYAVNKNGTFQDFLMGYSSHIFDDDWFYDELRKGDKSHPYVKLSLHYDTEFRKQHQGKEPFSIVETNLDSYMAYYIRFCYDLYTLDMHNKLQEIMVHRLKNCNFFSARYELLVIATFIRAGLKIDYEDETDTTSTHVEFIATDEETGQNIAVECKSLTPEKIFKLEMPSEEINPDEIKVSKLISRAYRQSKSMPYLIFLELNKKKSAISLHDAGISRKIISTLKRISLSQNLGNAVFNRIYVTNISPFYDEELGYDAIRDTCYIDAAKPNFPICDSTLDKIGRSLFQLGAIPSNFPSSNFTHA